MDPMQKISVYINTLSKAEKTTCELIMEKPEVVINNPIAEAAEIYQVSPSSILRLSKKLKYKGYSEFRYALEAHYKKDSSKNEQHHFLYNKVVNAYQSSFNELQNNFDEEKIMELVQIIKTKNIKTVGIGNSSLPAKQLVYSLYMEDKWSECVDESVKIGFLKKSLGTQDAVILFTVTGEHDSYLIEMKKWRSLGTKIIVITTNPEAKIKKYSDLTIVLPAFPLSLYQSSKHIQYLENRSIFYVFIDILLAYYVTDKNTNL